MPAVGKNEEQKYLQALKKLFQKLIDETRKGDGILNGDMGQIRSFLHSEEVDAYLENAVGRMTKSIRVESAKSWREAVTQGTNSRLLYQLIQNEMKGPVGRRVWELVSENVAFIKTIPDNWKRYAEEYIYRETLKGKRPEQIQKELMEKLPEHCLRNLTCVARTESAKVNAEIVQARAEMCGIHAYFWRCVSDERSRSAHRKMDGILVFYNDPPNPEALFPSKGQRAYGSYHAGNTFNCRCFQEPVVDVRFLPDIVRAHDHGEIKQMTKAQLIRRYQVA